MNIKNFILEESNGQKTRFIKNLSSIEYKELEDVQQRILEFRYFARRIKEIELNYDCLIITIEQYELLSRTKGLEISQLDLCFIDINRLLINFIDSFKFFIEYLGTHFKKHGEASHEYNIFKRFTVYCYESYFSYKLFYNLRNYSQHNDFPLFYFKEERDYRTGEREVKMGFSKLSLLKDRDLNKKIGADLRSYPECFPVKPLLIQVLKPLKQLDIEIYRICENEIISIVNILSCYKKHVTLDGSLLSFGTASPDQGMWKITSNIIELTLLAKIEGKLKNYKMHNFT